ncbi:MAG TPA: sulfite exporter TauE/SafE family protein [Candidatus Acidoferrum sp.]|nr:sulfite exporter TauE/SafE family protein [Candidatus Acidoferrum sp.]
MMQALLGFAIALVVGLTGIGGGSFTVPALLVFVGLPAPEAVGTAFVFAGVLRLLAAPFYLAERRVHARYSLLLLQGAIPGLILGMLALRLLGNYGHDLAIVFLLGFLLAVTASISFIPRAQNPTFARKNSRWLPWLAFPLGIEAGFSSAGAGALGTVLLLNYSEMSPGQVVGTDLLFGLVLALIGSVVHWTLGTISTASLWHLLAGGIPGVLAGCLLNRRIPAQKLKAAVALIALAAGLQLMWSGASTFFEGGSNAAANWRIAHHKPRLSLGTVDLSSPPETRAASLP